MAQPHTAPLNLIILVQNPWAPQGLFSPSANNVHLALLWPLGQYREAGDDKTGLYASIMGHNPLSKVGCQIGTYSAYSQLLISCYADPAPFTALSVFQEVYPISYSLVC